MKPANKVFLTGGTGFFGKSILSMLKRGFGTNLNFTVLARAPAEFLADNPEFNGSPMAEFIPGDIRDFSFPEQNFDYILHAAPPAPCRRQKNGIRIVGVIRGYGSADELKNAKADDIWTEEAVRQRLRQQKMILHQSIGIVRKFS